MQENNVTPFFIGKAYAALVGPEAEEWDQVGIVQYDSLATFEKIVTSEVYKKECEPHRLAALEDWRLIPVEQIEL